MRLHEILITGLLMAVYSAAAAGEAKDAGAMTPAHVGSGKKALYNVIEFPETRQAGQASPTTVNCQIIVSKKGKAIGSRCFPASEPQPAEYVAAVFNALTRARFVPARVDGKPVAVAMNLQVVFTCEGGNCDTVTLPNFGLNAAEIGRSYVSPQEIVDPDTWYERFIRSDACADGSAVSANCTDNRATRLAVRFSIDEAGRVTLAEAFRDEFGNKEQLLAAAIDEARQARFIPGVHDGKFVAMSGVHPAILHDDNPIVPRICVEEGETGSRLRRKKCYTAQEYARRQAESGNLLEQIFQGTSTF